MDSNMKRDLILEHNSNPINRGLLNDDSYIKINTRNESCIDNIDIMILIKDDIIKDIRFDGEACAISTSATSLMINSLLNKTIEEAKNILVNYENMIDEKDYDKELLQELNAYDEIYKQPNRKKCALLPWVAIKKCIETYNK